MKAWKHHLSTNFESGHTPRDCNPGKGGDIFLDRAFMTAYLEDTGDRWHVCEIYVDPSEYESVHDHPDLVRLKCDIPRASLWYPSVGNVAQIEHWGAAQGIDLVVYGVKARTWFGHEWASEAIKIAEAINMGKRSLMGIAP